MPHDHVLVAVEPGRSRQEELAVTALGDGEYCLEVPPAMTRGLAVGDVFTIDPETRRPEIVKRSGNLTVWLYPRQAIDEARRLHEEAEALGGRLEGAALDDRVFIFTFPIASTFPAIERIFEVFADDHPESEWLYGNVFADDGVTPLGWWN